MRFKGELKEKIDKCETKEQTVEILDKVGIELTDEELENVSGGKYTPLSLSGRTSPPTRYGAMPGGDNK